MSIAQMSQPQPPNVPDTTQEEYRMWLMLLTSLAATVTFTAGHAPPGGFWSADDKAKGYVAGTSVMRDKFPIRYMVFYYCNTAAFFLSLGVIVMLAQIKKGNCKTTGLRNRVITFLVSACIASLGTSYIAGSLENPIHGMTGMLVFTTVLLSMLLHYWIMCGVASTMEYVSSGLRKILDRFSPPKAAPPVSASIA